MVLANLSLFYYSKKYARKRVEIQKNRQETTAPIYDMISLMDLQKNLLEWFRQNQRPLPWRRNYRPYEVWVSEIMLQQTQMDTVLPYFDRWMKNFPTIES